MPPITTHFLQTEHNHVGPAPDQWGPVPGMEFRLENHHGFGPKEYGLRVNVANQEGEVLYRVMVDGVALDQEHHNPPGQGDFHRTKTEVGPVFPNRTVSLEWRQFSPGAGLGPDGKVSMGLMNCAWGIP